MTRMSRLVCLLILALALAVPASASAGTFLTAQGKLTFNDHAATNAAGSAQTDSTCASPKTATTSSGFPLHYEAFGFIAPTSACYTVSVDVLTVAALAVEVHSPAYDPVDPGSSFVASPALAANPTEPRPFSFDAVQGQRYEVVVRLVDSLLGTAIEPPRYLAHVDAPHITTGAPIVLGELPQTTLVGDPYQGELAATGGLGGPFQYAVADGTLPAGLSLAAATGSVTGSATAAGVFALVASATDGARIGMRSQEIRALTPIAITTTSLPGGTLGDPYSHLVAATGGNGPLSWTVTAGSLPPGLALAQATGVLSGTPTQQGGFTFTITVGDGIAPSASREFTVAIVPKPITITTLTLPSVLVGDSYLQSVQATGGNGPLTWSVSAGSLPTGVSIDGSSGGMSGQTTQTGTFTFTITVSDGLVSASREYTVTVIPRLSLAPANPQLPDAPLGSPYAVQFTATGGTGGPYTFSLPDPSFQLPPGLSLNASTGQVTGTPTTTGTYLPFVRVTDGTQTVNRPYQIKVTEPPVTFSLNKLVDGAVDANLTWSFTLTSTSFGLNASDTNAPDGSVDFGGTQLVKDAQYTVCERALPATYTAAWTLNGQPIVPVNPDAPSDDGDRCHTFTPTAGQQLAFVIDNRRVVTGEPAKAGHWRFGEASGTLLTDSSGNGNHGAYSGNVTLGVSGAPGFAPNTAATFDGVDDLGRVPDSSSLDVGGSFSVEGWIKRSSTAKSHQLMAKGGGLQLAVMSAGNGSQVFLRKANVTTLARSQGGVPADGRYHHVVATMSGPGNARIYIDGVPDTVQLSTVHAIADTAHPLTFGTVSSGSAQFDEFALYDDVLTDAQVLAHRQLGAGP